MINYCPIHGDLLAGPLSSRCSSAPEGHAIRALIEPPVIPVWIPHIPYGPRDVPEALADADYFDHAARSIAGGHAVGGYNVTHAVIHLLHNVATALRAAHGPTEQESGA